MTDEMLEKAADHAKENGYTNVEFKKGDIEKGIPINDNIADVVISNCVINLTIDNTAIKTTNNVRSTILSTCSLFGSSTCFWSPEQFVALLVCYICRHINSCYYFSKSDGSK